MIIVTPEGMAKVMAEDGKEINNELTIPDFPQKDIYFEESDMHVKMNEVIKPLYFLPTNNGNTVGPMVTPYSHKVGATSSQFDSYLRSRNYDNISVRNTIENLLMERFTTAVDNNINIIINDDFGKIIDQYAISSEARSYLASELNENFFRSTHTRIRDFVFQIFDIQFAHMGETELEADTIDPMDVDAITQSSIAQFINNMKSLYSSYLSKVLTGYINYIVANRLIDIESMYVDIAEPDEEDGVAVYDDNLKVAACIYSLNSSINHDIKLIEEMVELNAVSSFGDLKELYDEYINHNENLLEEIMEDEDDDDDF